MKSSLLICLQTFHKGRHCYLLVLLQEHILGNCCVSQFPRLNVRYQRTYISMALIPFPNALSQCKSEQVRMRVLGLFSFV
jgi:hypothetical protein